MSLVQEPTARVTGDTPDLTPHTRLQVAPGLRTRFDALGHVLIDSPDGALIDVGPRGFAILSLFSRPVALGDVIARLEARGREFLPTISVVNTLIEEGALVTSEAEEGPKAGWADPVEHARMLHDSRRTSDYMAAVRAAVRPGDVVLDLGTGSGVLAVAAARAGARRVYAVEATDIAEVADRVFAANGVEDRVTLIPGWSRQVELPEPADVLVAEVIGSEPLAEEILETTLDARRRLLKPKPRLLPHTLTLFARPLLIPEAEARQRAIGRKAIERWGRLYGIDFQPLLDAATPGPVNAPTEAEVAARWPAVGSPAVLAALDLASFEDASIDAETDLAVDLPGDVNAVAVTFRADLYGAVTHTLDPWMWPTSSWATSVWVFPDQVEVGPEAILRLHYTRRVAGSPDRLSFEVVEPGAS